MTRIAGALGLAAGLASLAVSPRDAAPAPGPPRAVYLYVNAPASPEPGSGNWRFRLDPASGVPIPVETSHDDGTAALVAGRGSRFAYSLVRSMRALELRAYHVDPDTGRVSRIPHAPVRLEFGPARIVSHPAADVLYLLSRADLQALPLDPATGVPIPGRSSRVFVGATATAAELSADGRRLFVDRRGRDWSLRSYELVK